MSPNVCLCKINVSVEKDWITDSTMKRVLQNYSTYVVRLNLRGCTSLKWISLKCISEYRVLPDSKFFCHVLVMQYSCFTCYVY